MVLTVTEDTPADMLAGSMELRVQLPRDHQLQTQRVTVQRSTPMMDLLVQIATAHKLAASSYTLQAIGERGLILPHQPNTPIGALDALQVKLLPKQGTFVPRKTKQANQPFETTFRLQVHLPRNQLYVSRVSPKMNLGEILDEVCREKNLDRNKYELRHPANLEETLDLSLSLQDYHLQEVTLYGKQGRTLGSALSTQDIMALQRQEERRRQQARQGVFGFTFKKSKEGSLSTDSLGGRSASPARSDETGRSASPLQPPARPQRKRRPAPKPPIQVQAEVSEESTGDSSCKDKVVISHSRNSSDSSGYHEASILSDNPDSAGRLPETLPRRSRAPTETPRKLAHTSQSSKSLGNLATVSGTLAHGISSTSLSSTGLRKKRAAPPPPVTRPLSSAISTQALERIVDSEESLTSDIDPSKPPSDIGAPSKANSDIEDRPKASSDIGVTTTIAVSLPTVDFETSSSDILTTESETENKSDKLDIDTRRRSESLNVKLTKTELEAAPVKEAPLVEARVTRKKVGEPAPLPKPWNISTDSNVSLPPQVPKRRVVPLSRSSKSSESRKVESLSNASSSSIAGASNVKTSMNDSDIGDTKISSTHTTESNEKDYENSTEASVEEPGEMLGNIRRSETIDDDVFLSFETDSNHGSFENHSIILGSVGAINPESWEVSNNLEVGKEKLQSNLEIEKSENFKLNSDDKITPGTMKSKEIKTISKQNKKLCAVISTLPKCDHLDCSTEQKLVVKTHKVRPQAPSAKGIKDIVATNNHLPMQNQNEPLETIVRNKHEEDVRDAKRLKIVRSASKLNDFEVNSLERQKRHLTSHAEDITFALNLNLSSNADLLSNLSRRLEDDLETRRGDEFEPETSSRAGCEEQSQHGLGISDADLSETDILLQKVSDTLTNSMPVSTSNEVPTSPSEPNVSPIETKMVLPDYPPAKVKPPSIDKPDGNQIASKPSELSEGTVNASTPNVTLGSQQDTSDYVSAIYEDLSIAEWEYQLPAPPSAFRDTASPVFDNFDTAQSTEVLKDTEINLKETETIAPFTDEKQKVLEILKNERVPITENFSSEGEVRRQPEMKCPIAHQKLDDSLKKEMIYELENKIGSFPQKEFESRKVENPSTPKLAPVDNTLSNFTITTYTRQKSLNIFDEVESQSYGKMQERSVRSLATLPRNKKNLDDAEDTSGRKDMNPDTPRYNKGTNKPETVSINVSCGKLEPKMNDQQESLERRQVINSDNEKTNLQRSESYASTYDNTKHRRVTCETDKRGGTNDRNLVERNSSVKSSTSITNLNGGATRNNEKFSQWRDNILKRQEEPTKERQLQSLQVLKSILPQLMSAQQAEENVSKENNDTVLTERTRFDVVSNEDSTRSNVVVPGDSQTASNCKKEEQESKKSTSEINTKRYTYSGPPAITLGSWTERPSVNVQIKMDTDYKLGVKRITNGRTIVNINGAQDEVDCNSRVENDAMLDGAFLKSSRKFGGKTEQKEPDELTRKLITHMTASGFKKSISSKDNSEFKTTMGTSVKPVVTGVELKKSLIEKSETKKEEGVVDTSSLNFKELTKAFGQDISLRSKPKRSNMNRHSDLYSMSSETIQQIHANKQNGHSKSEKLDTNDRVLLSEVESNSKPKRFTSIVGVNAQNQNQNFVSRNNLIIKNSNSMPVVKGFKIQNAKIDGCQTDYDSSKSPSKGFVKESLKQQVNGGPQPPRPPTMPVITGVTLKSTNVRPKSMPAHVDPRDTLMESIRNFGGRNNLKSAEERC